MFTPTHKSIEVRRLVEQGQTIAADEMWTYENMQALLGRAVAGSDTVIQRALQRLSRDHGVEFENVRKVGYLRLSDSGIVDHGKDDRASIARKVRRATQRSANVADYAGLTPKQRTDLDVHRTILAVMREAAKPRAGHVLESKVTATHGQIDALQASVELFRK